MLGRKLLSVVLATMFMGTGILVMAQAGSVGNGAQPAQDPVSLDAFIERLNTDPDYEIFEESGFGAADKISDSLQEKIYAKVKVKLAIFTSDVRELALALEDYDYSGTALGNEASAGKMAVPIIEIDSSAVERIAALPGVIGIEEYVSPVPLVYDSSALDAIDAASGPGVNGIADYSSLERLPVFHHRADKAWDKGYTGIGVNVAIIDTGVDFAHPDLYGTQARVNDASSPYNGWPIAFDPASMAAYVTAVNANTSWDDTWYANTSEPKQ